jgi:hypothetical protein
MTGPLDKQPAPGQPGIGEPAPPDIRTQPYMPVEPTQGQPSAPRDVAYPPRPIPQQAPQPFPQAPMYPAAPQHMPPGYPQQASYPVYTMPMQMPIVITQNNSVGGTIQVRRGVNHGLHLMLTLLTCGMWAPVWLIVWIFSRK